MITTQDNGVAAPGLAAEVARRAPEEKFASSRGGRYDAFTSEASKVQLSFIR